MSDFFSINRESFRSMQSILKNQSNKTKSHAFTEKSGKRETSSRSFAGILKKKNKRPCITLEITFYIRIMLQHTRQM